MSKIPNEEKLKLLAEAIYNAANIGMWCFGMERKLIYSTCPYEDEFRMFLEIGGCLDAAYNRTGGCEKPMVLNDSTGMMWIAENMYKDGMPVLMIVLGPVFISSTSPKSIENSLKSKNLSISMKKQMMRLMSDVPVVMRSMLNQYSIMFHYILTGEKVHPREFIYPKNIEEIPEEEEFTGKAVDSERIVQGEKLILQAIRNGNMNYLQVMDEHGDLGGAQLSHTGNSLRDAKNTLLIFCALCSRAAMDGGVSAKTAKEIENRFIEKIEASESIEKLINLNLELMQECVQKVNQCNQNPKVSRVVFECCDYIRANLLKPLTVEMIAKEMGYTEYYFTKKFNKEMGIKLMDYVKQERIEYAKIALITTKKSIQDISDALHFGTRNYFSKVFHELVGVTPAVYRENMGVKGKKDTKNEL